MNNEQIKEVMRLSDDIRTAHTSEWDVSDLVEAQNDLEAYLRTIGEPENTFPLNPNGSPQGIAGVSSADGRVTIMMPHPERVFRYVQNSWAPQGAGEDSGWMRLFRNARRALG